MPRATLIFIARSARPCWSQTYNYDTYGNMTCALGWSGLCASMGYGSGSSDNNQTKSFGSYTPTYDAAGNTTYDGSTYTYVWDAEGRLSSDSGPVANCYTYNALGQMMENSRTSSSHAELPYDTFGHDLGHFSKESGEWWEEYIPFGGTALAFYDQFTSQMRFLHRNALGSAIFDTDGDGNYLEDTQYYPFGGSSSSSEWNEEFAEMPWNDGEMQYLTLFRRYDAGPLADARPRWAGRRGPHQPPVPQPICVCDE